MLSVGGGGGGLHWSLSMESLEQCTAFEFHFPHYVAFRTVRLFMLPATLWLSMFCYQVWGSAPASIAALSGSAALSAPAPDSPPWLWMPSPSRSQSLNIECKSSEKSVSLSEILSLNVQKVWVWMFKKISTFGVTSWVFITHYPINQNLHY